MSCFSIHGHAVEQPSTCLAAMQPSPRVAIAHKLAAQLTRLEQEFGMTPSARTRISVPVAPLVRDSLEGRFFNHA